MKNPWIFTDLQVRIMPVRSKTSDEGKLTATSP